MATLELDRASGRYRVRFRYAGRSFKRSTRTRQRRVADAVLGQVEETLRLLRMGMAEVPPNVDPGEFIVTGARAKEPTRPPSPIRTLADLFRVYQQELPSGSKEERTLRGERLHMSHLLRHLSARTSVDAITTAMMQRYVERRSRDEHRGQSIGPSTIKKEITTLRLIWNWAVKQGYLSNGPPVAGLVYPKRDEKPHFMTMAEIKRVLGRAGLSRARTAELWESLYLIKPEVEALLECVRRQKRDPFVYPMFLLAAHTGMRRSELVRIEVTDLDFEGRSILVREKKRSRKHALSFRRVPMTELVQCVLAGWVQTLPEGSRVLSRPWGEWLVEDTILTSSS